MHSDTGKYGEYPCVNKSVEVGGYVAEGGIQTAILLYPKAAIANGTTLPFVAFAHGIIHEVVALSDSAIDDHTAISDSDCLCSSFPYSSDMSSQHDISTAITTKQTNDSQNA